GQDDTREGALEFGRRHAWHNLREIVDRAFDRQALGATRFDVIRNDVDEQHRNARACPIGAERASDRARTPDDDRLVEVWDHARPIAWMSLWVATCTIPSCWIQPRAMP